MLQVTVKSYSRNRQSRGARNWLKGWHKSMTTVFLVRPDAVDNFESQFSHTETYRHTFSKYTPADMSELTWYHRHNCEIPLADLGWYQLSTEL